MNFRRFNATDEIASLTPEPGDIIIIRSAHPQELNLSAIDAVLTAMNLDIQVLVIGQDMEIEQLDEDIMLAHGWARLNNQSGVVITPHEQDNII